VIVEGQHRCYLFGFFVDLDLVELSCIKQNISGLFRLICTVFGSSNDEN
jgi:hypothetical protein